MSGFDSVLMVDWSGGGDRGRKPKKDAIWSALVGPGSVPATEYHRNRASAECRLRDILAAELDSGRRVLAGFDFPFAYPAGFAECIVGSTSPLILWDFFAGELPADAPSPARFELAGRLNGYFPGTGPFWFNGLCRDIDQLPRKGGERRAHGMAERRHVEDRAAGTFTCWQMGGAGAVGSQVMTGMAALSRLRSRFTGQVAVWPFEPLDKPLVLAEMWPSLLAAEVRAALAADPARIRDEVQVRLLSAALSRMASNGTLDAALAATGGPALAEEGWILGVGSEADLRRAAVEAPA